MGNQLATLLTENEQLEAEKKEARADARTNKRNLEKLEKTFAKEKKAMAELELVLEAGKRDIDRVKEKYIALMKNLGVEVKESDLPSPSVRINLEGHKIHRENE